MHALDIGFGGLVAFFGPFPLKVSTKIILLYLIPGILRGKEWFVIIKNTCLHALQHPIAKKFCWIKKFHQAQLLCITEVFNFMIKNTNEKQVTKLQKNLMKFLAVMVVLCIVAVTELQKNLMKISGYNGGAVHCSLELSHASYHAS